MKNDEEALVAAIEHVLDVAESGEVQCSMDHRQLAEWLTELRGLRATIPPPTIPDDYVDQVITRDSEEDLSSLARAIVLDRLTTPDPSVFTDYVMEGGDLLIGSVNDALKTVTPKNPMAAQEWEAYVLDLVDSVRTFVLEAISVM